MQHCFYSSSNSAFETAPQEGLKDDQMQYGSNFSWSQFTPQEYSHYVYPGVYTEWIGENKPHFQHQFQWESNQEMMPLCSSANSPSIPQPPEHPPDSDLEVFAEHFKQRRMKLGITQADVGKALGGMMIPGVESLSQSTICRFESLTLSRTNMIALRPLLQIWLDRTEALGAASSTSQVQDSGFFSPGGVAAQNGGNPNRRKRTCITDSEKRALEAYFAVQSQPSSDRISQIATLLGLPKSVVRVWFCNQRQKQKRLKWGFENGRSRGVGESRMDVEYFSR